VNESAPLSPPPDEVVAERVRDLRRRIEAAGRDPAEVSIVAVTKSFSPRAVQAVLAAGIEEVGENYAAELVEKAAAIGGVTPTPRWQYLGVVQRRRVRDLAPVVSCWQTLARREEGVAIAARAPGAAVFVQVDESGAPGRNGVAVGGVPALVAELRDLGLRVRGLMVVAPPGPDAVARRAFATVREAAADAGLAELSMGMSGDIDVALREGTTMVRVGRALLGERPAPARRA
jgi:uncharacterized pyridoxal phosphate-containing UPF0001 family protein